MAQFEKRSSTDFTESHPDVWEDEYRDFCATNDNGYVTKHHEPKVNQVKAERRALLLMDFLEELRDREIQGWRFRYRADNVPQVEVDFFDHDEGVYGTGIHIFPTK